MPTCPPHVVCMNMQQGLAPAISGARNDNVACLHHHFEGVQVFSCIFRNKCDPVVLAVLAVLNELK